MRESAVRYADSVIIENHSPGLAKVKPEWPMMSHMLNSELFYSFADSVVRLLGFAAQCEPDHPCLLDEAILFQSRGNSLKEHIAQFRSTQLWSVAEHMAFSHIRKLALRRVNEMGFDEDLEEAVKEEVIRLNLDFLKS